MHDTRECWLARDEYYQRGMAAYFRTWDRSAGEAVQPSQSDSGTCTVGGRRYVRLANNHGILRVYRVKNDGLLRRLTRWPRALEADLG